MFRFASIALALFACSTAVVAWEPEDGTPEPPHRNLLVASNTGCMITESTTITTTASADAINEPCYIHDALCEGYQVCCVTKGTCKDAGGMVSSNAKYYEGGCWSLDSSKKAMAEGCAKQGECNEVYLQYMMNGKTATGKKAALPQATVDKFMASANGNKCKTVCGDKDGEGAGTVAVSDTDCGVGFKADTMATAKICEGTACSPGTSAHDLEMCCVGATCGDKDGLGTDTAGITDADCGTGYVAKMDRMNPTKPPLWKSTKGYQKCVGAKCDVGSKTAKDQATCCTALGKCGAYGNYRSVVSDEQCGEGYIYDEASKDKMCSGASCVVTDMKTRKSTINPKDKDTCCKKGTSTKSSSATVKATAATLAAAGATAALLI
jgi:hypothetical protein